MQQNTIQFIFCYARLQNVLKLDLKLLKLEVKNILRVSHNLCMFQKARKISKNSTAKETALNLQLCPLQNEVILPKEDIIYFILSAL